MTTALDRTTSYSIRQTIDDGSIYLQGASLQQRVTTLADGLATTYSQTVNGQRFVELPDGTNSSSTEKNHKYWKAAVRVPNVSQLNTPGGRELVVDMNDALVMRDSSNPVGGVSTYSFSTLINGNSWDTDLAYDNNGTPGTATDDVYEVTAFSPEGRESFAELDYLGRVSLSGVPGFSAAVFNYDANGRIESVTRLGEAAPDDRDVTYEYYNASGQLHHGALKKVTDVLGRAAEYQYNADGFLSKVILPNSAEIDYTYDASGLLLSLQTPGGHLHQFTHDGVDLPSAYIEPAIGGDDFRTTSTYNADKQLTNVDYADGTSVTFVYEHPVGLLTSLLTTDGDYEYSYNAFDKLTTVTAPLDRGEMVFDYDGPLVTDVALLDNNYATGTLGYDYDDDLRVTQLTVQGDQELSYTYDDDGLLTAIADSTNTFALERDAVAGLLTTTTLGIVKTINEFTFFGERASDRATSDGAVIYQNDYSYDKGSRITSKTETLNLAAPASDTYAYGYDTRGQLTTVFDGASTTTYTYDAEGNRKKKAISGGSDVLYVYDAHNRLLESGDGSSSTTYTYNANGDLTAKTAPDDTVTSYSYDWQGNLTGVLVLDDLGTTVTDVAYALDPLGRRLARIVDGTVEQRWLYAGSLSPIAELDTNGVVQKLFVYATHVNVPDYILDLAADKTYRMLSDHLGSPRIVLDADSGDVVQEFTYDEFGQRTTVLDTTPELHPFGFAGGLFDAETGLSRFGAREYDDDGLLEKFIYPTGAEFTSAYDADGLLIAHSDQEGGAREFARTEKGTNWNVAVTTALERTTTYSVARIHDDGSYYVQGMEQQQRVITSPGDVATTITRTANGRTYTETPDRARGRRQQQQRAERPTRPAPPSPNPAQALGSLPSGARSSRQAWAESPQTGLPRKQVLNGYARK